MRTDTFSDNDRAALQHERIHHPCPRVRERMAVLALKAGGLTHEHIAAVAGLSRRTVQRYRALYRSGGLDALRRDNYRRPTGSLDPHAEMLENHFLEHPPRNARVARQVIVELTDVKLSLTRVRVFLRKIGLSWRKVGQVPAKADPDVQAAFVQDHLSSRLEEAKQGQRAVFFVDAAHFVHGPFIGFLWAAVRFFIRPPSGRQRYNMLGAVNAVTRTFMRVTNTTVVNGATMVERLRLVAGAGQSGPLMMVLDNARYQRCKLVQMEADRLGVELLFLPPYSPNLNLIERVWRLVKAECLATRYYSTFAEFRSAIDECANELSGKHAKALESLLTLRF